MVACEKGFAEIVELLLGVEKIDKDAVDQVDVYFTQIHIFSCCVVDGKISKIEKSENYNVSSEFVVYFQSGCTALMKAIEWSHLNIVMLLLKQRVNANKANKVNCWENN